MHSNSARSLIRVDLVGIDARVRERFETVFHDRMQDAYMVANSSVAEIAIVDLDSPVGQASWHRYCERFPNRPIILLSDTEPSKESGDAFLPKPIQVDQLIEVLETIRHRLATLDTKAPLGVAEPFAAGVEPETIRITEQHPSKLLDSAPWYRSRPSTTAPIQPCEVELGNAYGHVGAQGVKGLTEKAPDDPGHGLAADARQPLQRPDQNRHTAQSHPAEPGHSASTFEKTYRYPVPRTHDTHPVDRLAQQKPWYRKAADGGFAGQLNWPSDESGTSEKTSRLPPADARSPPGTLVPVQERLLGILQTTLRTPAAIQSAVQLTLGDGHLLLHAPRGHIYSSFTDHQLQQLATVLLTPTQVRIAPYEFDRPDASNGSPPLQWAWQTLEAFLWKLALWTYCGGLPWDTHLGKRVYLRHWPNFTRLHPVPHAMRIASLWNEQPMTLDYTAQALGISKVHVFNFYSASHTIGLAGQARREADYLFQEAASRPKAKHRFLSEVMKRLRSIGNR